MTEIISVRFKDTGKAYYFAPNGLKLKKGDYVVVETSRGMECGRVAEGNSMVEDDEVTSPLKPALRIATPRICKSLRKIRKKSLRLMKFACARLRSTSLR